MGFFDNYGVGVNAGVQNFLAAGQAKRQHALELQKLAQQKQLQEAQVEQARAHANYYLAQIEEQKRKAAQEEALGLREQNAVTPMPQYPPGMMGAPEAYPSEPPPMTPQDMIMNLARANPSKYASQLGQLATQENKINPIIGRLIEAAQNGTINDRGKAILQSAGYDMFSPKPEKPSLITGEGGVRVPDAPGVKAMDAKEVWSEPFEMNVGGKKSLVQKSSHGQVREVMGDKSTTILVDDSKRDIADRRYGAQLRKEFNQLPEIKESNTIMPKIVNMEKALEESKKTNNFVAVDQALITLYNKLTDPSSVVRESEYARTAMNMPLLNAIKGKIGKIQSGGAGLTPQERDAMVRMAKLMRDGYKEIRTRRIREYHSYAEDMGIDPKTVIRDEFNDIPKEAVAVEKKPTHRYVPGKGLVEVR